MAKSGMSIERNPFVGNIAASRLIAVGALQRVFTQAIMMGFYIDRIRLDGVGL